MTSKEIYDYLQTEKGIKELYKKYEKCFEIVDKWSDVYISGDLLDENELAFSLDQNTGVYSKLCIVVNVLESYMERILNNTESTYYDSIEKVKTQDTSIAKSRARTAVGNIRDYLANFKSYFLASQQIIVSAQSRLKRLTVEKGAKKIDYTGETPIEEEKDEPEKAWDE
jgi:hypothetical protein